MYYGKFDGWKKSDKAAVEIFPESTPLHWKKFKRFTGSFSENSPDQGTALMQTGSTYVGGFKNNMRNGQGTETWPTGTGRNAVYKSYSGYWDDDKWDKEGDLKW
jgi:hypothetical protein